MKIANNKNRIGALNNAFTLIELLAVIIILAIVALIATPIILNVINDARISAGRSEAQMIYSGINNYCQTEEMKYQLDNSYTKICTSSMTPDVVDQMVNLGNSKVNKLTYNGYNLIELEIESNNHIFRLCNDGSFAMDNESCPYECTSENSLICKLMKSYNISNEVGLVKDMNNPNVYYYKGNIEQVNNNYLFYGGHHWRVIEFDIEANTLTLVSQIGLTAISAASKSWETVEEYENSYINTWLNDYFYNTFDDDIKNNILDNTFNIGIYNDVDELQITQKVGLLDAEQVERTMVELGNEKTYLPPTGWLGNRSDVENRVKAYGYTIHDVIPTGSFAVIPVIKISDIEISDGEGTLTSNYKTAKKATTTGDIQVGEYIKLPTTSTLCGDDNMCNFRVSGKDNDSLKITLNGILKEASAFGDTTRYTVGNTLHTFLTDFTNTIPTEYLYPNEKEFYVGDYIKGSSYSMVQDETMLSKVGIPSLGELFSANEFGLSIEDGNISNDYIDISSIETYKYGYFIDNMFLLNRWDDVNVIVINPSYGIDQWRFLPTKSSGIRPVTFIKNNLTITGGDGTAQNPYVLN